MCDPEIVAHNLSECLTTGSEAGLPRLLRVSNLNGFKIENLYTESFDKIELWASVPAESTPQYCPVIEKETSESRISRSGLGSPAGFAVQSKSIH